MKALLPKHPPTKDSGIRREADSIIVDVHLRTPDGRSWRKRQSGLSNVTEARKVRDGFFAAYNLEVLGIHGTARMAALQDGPTVGELCDRCLTELWPRTASRSLDHYRSKVDCYIRPMLGALKVKDVDSKIVRGFVYDQADLKKEGKFALSIETVRHTKATLSAVLAVAVEDGTLAANPAQVKIAWQKLKDARGEVPVAKHILTGPELDRLIAAAKGTPIEWMVLFQARLGLRMGEALALSDKDFVGGVCRVRRQVKRRNGLALKPEPLKTGSSLRDIPCTESVLRAIEGHSGLFTVNEDGGLIEPRRATKIFAVVANKAGLKGLGTHDLRHTFCSRLLNEFGVPATVVQKIVGHSTIATTLSFYSHASSDQLQSAMAHLP